MKISIKNKVKSTLKIVFIVLILGIVIKEFSRIIMDFDAETFVT